MNSVLSIAIPTFNRAAFLDRTLAYHVPLLSKFEVPIIIRDNGSTDTTNSVVAKWQQAYPLIQYTRNNCNVGPDKNFELALRDAKTGYVWLLGDTYLISEEQVQRIIDEAVKNSPDFFVFNIGGRVNDLSSCSYNDCNKLLADLGWHMTCIAALVYKTSNLNKLMFARYNDTNFLQLGIILEFIAFVPFKVVWIADQSVQGLVIPGIRKVSWVQQAFDLWVERWTNFVFSLPAVYKIENKIKAIKDHGKKSGLFTLKGLLILRSRDVFTLKTHLKHRRLFFLAVPVNFLVSYFVLLLPSRFLNYFKCALMRNKPFKPPV